MYAIRSYYGVALHPLLLIDRLDLQLAVLVEAEQRGGNEMGHHLFHRQPQGGGTAGQPLPVRIGYLYLHPVAAGSRLSLGGDVTEGAAERGAIQQLRLGRLAQPELAQLLLRHLAGNQQGMHIGQGGHRIAAVDKIPQLHRTQIQNGVKGSGDAGMRQISYNFV